MNDFMPRLIDFRAVASLFLLGQNKARLFLVRKRQTFMSEDIAETDSRR